MSDSLEINQWLKSVLTAVLKHPALALPAIIQAKLLVPNNWIKKYPFLPLPDKKWIRFRMETAYGDPNYIPDHDEIAQFLGWTKVR